MQTVQNLQPNDGPQRPICLATKSPDVTALDFFSLGCGKDKVYPREKPWYWRSSCFNNRLILAWAISITKCRLCEICNQVMGHSIQFAWPPNLQTSLQWIFYRPEQFSSNCKYLMERSAGPENTWGRRRGLALTNERNFAIWLWPCMKIYLFSSISVMPQ